MLISVITPTRNRVTSFLRDCVVSVSCQRLPQGWTVEHIICDDGSDAAQFDALRDLAAGHSGVRVVRRPTPGGVSAARNTAFLASNGHIILDLDDDDIIPGDAVAMRVAHLLASGRSWSCGNMLKVDEEGRYLIGKDVGEPIGGAPEDQDGFMSGLLDGTVYAWAGTRTYLRSALLTAGPWDTSFVVAEDLEHWLRLTALVGAPAWYTGYAVIYREKARSLGIDALHDGSMAAQAERARSRYSTWPDLPRDLPGWDGVNPTGRLLDETASQ